MTERKVNKLHKGSYADTLAQLDIGQHTWFDTTPVSYARDMNTIVKPPSRRAKALGDKTFTCMLFTAVSNRPGEVCHLIRVERTS